LAKKILTDVQKVKSPSQGIKIDGEKPDLKKCNIHLAAG
jgi:hypothetical protein